MDSPTTPHDDLDTLDVKPALTGESLGKLLADAMNDVTVRRVRTDYERYRLRAIAWRGKRTKLLPHETEDPRFFEMRISGMDPERPEHNRDRFFGHRDDDRRELVMFSRAARVRYCSPPENFS